MKKLNIFQSLRATVQVIILICMTILIILYYVNEHNLKRNQTNISIPATINEHNHFKRLKKKNQTSVYIPTRINLTSKISLNKKTGIEECRHRNQMFVHFEGRLGNQMFELASLYGLSKFHNKTPVLIRGNSNKMLFELFNLTENNPDLLIAKEYPTNVRKVYSSKAGGFDKNLLRYTKCDVHLFGYLQSWKYFDDYQQDISKQFTFKKDIIEKVDIILQSIKNKFAHDLYKGTDHVSFIGVHIRRGDFLHPHHIERGFLVAPVTYIKKAMNYFKSIFKNIIFIVCSDDINWVKAYLAFSDVYVSENQPANIDFALLASCNHSIITVGTFGWWSAYLANSRVVYYSEYPRKGSILDKVYNKSDHYPSSWISMGH